MIARIGELRYQLRVLTILDRDVLLFQLKPVPSGNREKTSLMRKRNVIKYLSKNREETVKLGERLAHALKGGDIVCLSGDLGSGKTTFTKGIARGLKIKEEAVNSPTFVLMNAYEGRLPLFHFDLYRLDKEGEILNLGYEEFLYGNGVSVIEWAEKLGELTPKDFLKIQFENKSENERLLTLLPLGKRAKEITGHLKI